VRAGRVGPREPLEQVGQQLLGYARAVVGHRDDEPGRGRQRPVGHGPRPRARLPVGQGIGDAHGDRGAVGRVPPGVGQQVAEDLPQPVLVAKDLFRVVGQLEHPAVVGTSHLGVARGVDGQPGHVDGLAAQRPARVEPGEQQQVVDEDAHPGGLGQHAAEGVRHLLRGVAAPQQGELRVAADGGQGSAQLVAGVGGEAAQPGLARRPPSQGVLHVAEHPVERQSDLAGLGGRIRVGHPGGQRHLAGLQRQLGHLRGRGGDPAQRAEREPDPEEPDDPGEYQHRGEDRAFGERHVVELVVEGAQRQPGVVHRAVAVGVLDRGELVPAVRPAQVARRAVRGVSVPEVGGRRDPEQGLLVRFRQRDRVVGDEVAAPVAVLDHRDERVLAKPRAADQAGRTQT
jgi:hypothetical protein